MLTVPHTSTSHALGSSSLLIIHMIVHGTTPKNSSSEVQHCTALIVTSASTIQPSITVPSFAIFRSAASGIPSVGTYSIICSSFSIRGGVVVLEASTRPRISDRSIGSTAMPFASRIFSL